jgi:hypothetical protein
MNKHDITIAIQGHPAKGRKIIDTLIKNGGVNRFRHKGTDIDSYYHLNVNGEIIKQTKEKVEEYICLCARVQPIDGQYRYGQYFTIDEYLLTQEYQIGQILTEVSRGNESYYICIEDVKNQRCSYCSHCFGSHTCSKEKRKDEKNVIFRIIDTQKLIKKMFLQ